MNNTKILSTEIKEGERIAKVETLGPNDISTLAVLAPFGDDSAPPAGLTGTMSETGASGEGVLLGVQSDHNVATNGEKRIYSTTTDGKEVKAFIMLRVDGTMELLGTGDFLVKFNEMNSAFGQLKSDFDSLVNLYNAHIHVTTATVGPTAVPGVIAPTASTGSPTTADMSAAKAENLKTL